MSYATVIWASTGGWGNAGGMRDHKINFDKYHHGYFEKMGMRNYHLDKN